MTKDTRNLLERATAAAPDLQPDLQGLYDRRARHARGARLRAGAVAALIAIGGVAVAFNMLSSSGGRLDAASGDRIGSPVLFLHSPDDDIVPIGEGRRLFEAAPQPKQFVEVSGGHVYACERDPQFFPAIRR